jgi:L-amino acid N-acyltransferase YncA
MSGGAGEGAEAPEVRPATPADRADIWRIMAPVIRAGETYALPPAMDEAAALAYWFQPGNRVFVATLSGNVGGTCILRANQQGGGDHVANAAFMTAAEASGQGLAWAMCQRLMDEARAAGFSAMQFNFVVASNARAVRLWQSLGFATVGRLPGAFRHPKHGPVDALVMFRTL